MFRNEDDKLLHSQKLLKDEQGTSFSYGYTMIAFARLYHEIKLLEMEEPLPKELEIDSIGNNRFRFVQKPGEPEVWKSFYGRLRRTGWIRKNPAQSQGTTLTIFLYKGDKEDPICVVLEVMFPECKVELVETIEEVVKKPIYKITCGEGTKLEDPEPQMVPETTPADPTYTSSTLFQSPSDNDIPF